MKRTDNGTSYTHYWTMRSELEQIDPTIIKPLDLHKPWIPCTNSGISTWIDEMYPGTEITFPSDGCGGVLRDAIRALELYGFLKLYLIDRTTNKKYEVRFMEI